MANPNELIYNDLVNLAVDVLNSTENSFKDLNKILKKLEKELLRQLFLVDPVSAISHNYRLQRLSKLVRRTRELITEGYNLAYRLNRSQNKIIAFSSAAAVTSSLQNALGFELVAPVMSSSLLIAITDDNLILADVLKSWWRKQRIDLIDGYIVTVQQSVLAGESVTKTAASIKERMSIASRHAHTLARTGAMSVNNSASMASYKENDDIIKGLTWLSTLDTRTTQICRTLDGKRWFLSSGRVREYSLYKPYQHKFRYPGPLAHVACRSTQTPWLKSAEELGIKVNKVPESTRASIDGPVPESTNYNTWLKRQSRARQVDILGPQKYRLWKDNHLEMSDLLDFKTNKPFTIEQLKEKYE